MWRLLSPRHAAVAIVLRAEGPQVLLTQRVRRANDRWSGHVALPGGMPQTSDRDLLQTAMRETLEEVGLGLQRAEHLGSCDEARSIAPRGHRPMAVRPHVFVLQQPATLRLGPEVADAFWFPLDQAAAGTLDGFLLWRAWGLPIPFRCWRYRRWVVWGLTYRVLRGLLTLAG